MKFLQIEMDDVQEGMEVLVCTNEGTAEVGYMDGYAPDPHSDWGYTLDLRRNDKPNVSIPTGMIEKVYAKVEG